MRGKDGGESALQEAWEEAGVRESRIDPDPVGTYTYNKRQSTGWGIPVETMVYSVAVDKLEDSFPEAHERRRRWVNAETAAELVNETELKTLFESQ